jgi:hypothetical protein
MFARHAAKHQTKDKINFLKQCVLFNHWTMEAGENGICNEEEAF